MCHLCSADLLELSNDCCAISLSNCPVDIGWQAKEGWTVSFRQSVNDSCVVCRVRRSREGQLGGAREGSGS